MRTQSPPATVRPLAREPDREFVVEVTSPIARNALYRAYRALFAIGVQVLHTTLRMKDGDAVQTLHLAELDDARLDAPRALQALAALNEVCSIPNIARVGPILGQ